MITIYFKTTLIIIKFLEQCILPRIMPVSNCLFVVIINLIRHQTKKKKKKLICVNGTNKFKFLRLHEQTCWVSGVTSGNKLGLMWYQDEIELVYG